jgi:RNA polymerase sigma factor (sigma-70 family)
MNDRMEALTDADLWSQARGGDATAFGELYQRHARSVQSYCLWRTAALQVAEDVTATTFLEAWRRRRRLELTTETAAPLLLGVATNVLRNHWRSQRRHARALERIARRDSGLEPSHEDEAAARIDAIVRVREAGAAIRALPLREREVLGLLVWGELTYSETAAALDIPVGSVRSRVARARSRLGDAFADLAPLATPTEDPLP